MSATRWPSSKRSPGPGRQRGVALLLAMLIVTLVVTFAAGMLWQQARAIEVEGAERVRAQADWLFEGTMDWTRIILREDATGMNGRGNVDSPDETWAIPIRDAKLGDFIANDKTGGLSGPDATLSGQITDAQGRYNLRQLTQGGKPEQIQARVAQLQRLCQSVGLPDDTAGRIASAMKGVEATNAAGLITPARAEQLAWLGLAPEVVKRLLPHVTILPEPTPVNINTATPEALVAAVQGMDRGTAERIIRARPAGGYESLEAVRTSAGLPEAMKLMPTQVSVATNYFEVVGELRYDKYILRERALMHRQQREVTIIRRERLPPESG